MGFLATVFSTSLARGPSFGHWVGVFAMRVDVFQLLLPFAVLQGLHQRAPDSLDSEGSSVPSTSH